MEKKNIVQPARQRATLRVGYLRLQTHSQYVTLSASQVLGYGKYTSQKQLNFINIKCHINDYMFRPFLFN